MAQKLVILGAGPMGLAAAWQALKRGWEVDVLEAGDRPGGMAAHFDFDGLSIERFYHFCCLSDVDTFELLEELGMPEKMKWVSTKMGLYFHGELHPWGDPISLLTFPDLGLVDKFRYGLHAFMSTRRKDWSKLDKITAEEWYSGWLGHKGYLRLWRPLLHFKFYEFAPRISAAWIWQRIKRVGRSRKSLFEERLGYVEGGSETLMNALADGISARGGRIHYKSTASKILVENESVVAIETIDGQKFETTKVISTIPAPYVLDLLPEQYPELKDAYRRINNVACVCVIHKLRKPVTKNFWVNIIDRRFEIPGIIEFSNLRPVENAIVYVPYYMPQTHEKFSWPDEMFIEESWACLKAINPALEESDRLAARVSRLKYAQPVPEPNFLDILPPVRTPISGLQIADTAFYYPEDRGVSESFRFAKMMVESLGQP